MTRPVREPGAAARIVAPRQHVPQVGELEALVARVGAPDRVHDPWQVASTTPPSRRTARSIAATAGRGSSPPGHEPLELAGVAVARRLGQQAAAALELDDGGRPTVTGQQQSQDRHRDGEDGAGGEEKRAARRGRAPVVPFRDATS